MTGTAPVRRRLVGGALRRYRESAGYTLEDSARVLECDRSKISRIETGQRGIRPRELRELLAEYGAPDGDRRALAAIAGRGRPGWWEPYRGALSQAGLDYLILEAAAAEIWVYDAQFVPDLLQTGDYARAVAAADPAGPPGPGPEETLEVRAARRQAVLGGGGPRLTVILGEAVLRQAVGGPAVLAGQLEHLARLAGADSRVALHVLPFSAGAHAAAGTGSLTILRFPDAPGLGVVSLEGAWGGVYLDRPADVARYLLAFERLRGSALGEQASAEMLRRPGG